MTGLDVRRVIVEVVDGAVFAMDDAGDVREHRDPVALVRWVKRRDEAAARRGVSTASVVEWRGMPEGFTPPEVDR